MVFMSGIMEVLDIVSKRDAGDADGPMTIFNCFNLPLFNTLWMQFVEQQGLMQTLRSPRRIHPHLYC